MTSWSSLLTWRNCFWLILPLLVWNLVYGPKITDPRITSDAHSPAWLLILENITRIAVFVLPLLIPLRIVGASLGEVLPTGSRLVLTTSGMGLIMYIIGMLIYFASWLPLLFAPGSAWSNSLPGLLAPRLTPFLCFLGIAMIGHSWTYAFIGATFTLLHTWHGIQNL